MAPWSLDLHPNCSLQKVMNISRAGMASMMSSSDMSASSSCFPSLTPATYTCKDHGGFTTSVYNRSFYALRGRRLQAIYLQWLIRLPSGWDPKLLGDLAGRSVLVFSLSELGVRRRRRLWLRVDTMPAKGYTYQVETTLLGQIMMMHT